MKIQILNTTLSYYSHWIGKQNILADSKEKICFIYSNYRNEVQQGYKAPFDLYIFYDKNRIIISYGQKAKEYICILREKIESVRSIDELKQVLFSVFKIKPSHYIKYVLTKPKHLTTTATILDKSHFLKFKDFFDECHNTTAGDWLYEWYSNMIKHKLCCGYILGDRIISCTDAPDVPYMQDKVQEIGVNTLASYKGKGYATECCLQCISNILNNNKIPIWSTTVDNISSQRLAEKTGFSKLADVLTITINI